jgi:hypothetical protein
MGGGLPDGKGPRILPCGIAQAGCDAPPTSRRIASPEVLAYHRPHASGKPPAVSPAAFLCDLNLDRRMPALLQLYDNFTRSLRPFAPLAPGHVGLYTCGPTVYDYQHIGNYRTFLFEDVLKRVLEWNGYAVRHVMNITDVGHLTSDADTGEDKMEKGARRTGKTAWEIARLYTDAFLADLSLLDIEGPTILCRATDHIREQIEFIVDIEKNGFAYVTPDGVYFDTSRQKD